jgi:hypothetical protein
MVLWVSTFSVSLPSTIAEMPRRPWDAITIKSHALELATVDEFVSMDRDV